MTPQTLYHKPFNSTSFDASDSKSRTVIKEYMAKKGFPFRDNGDKYGIDLIGDGFITALELEQRSTWNGSQYPYKTYHLPARKLKYFINSPYNPYFIVLNSDFTFALMISREKLLPFIGDMGKIQTVICQNSYKDSFFDVPISQFLLVNLNG